MNAENHQGNPSKVLQETVFVDFEENKKKRSFKRKMVLAIIPNTKFVYSLEGRTIEVLPLKGLFYAIFR